MLVKIFEAAARHPSRHVATAPLPAITRWKQHLEPATKQRVDAWARATWQPLRQTAGRSNNPEQKLLEATVLEFEAGFIEDAEAKALLLRRLDKRIQGDAPALPSSAYDVALKVLAQERGAAGLEPLTATVLELDDPTLERAVLVAPGYYTDPQQRMAAFDATLEGTLDPRVAFARIEALMGIHNESRRHDIQARVEAEWARISEIIPRQWRRRMPGLWAGAACTRGEAEGLTNLVHHRRRRARSRPRTHAGPDPRAD